MGKGNAHNLEWTWRIAAAQPPRKFGLQLQLHLQPMDAGEAKPSGAMLC